MTVCNGKLLFKADNGIEGMEIWISDGTEGGTSLLKNIAPGATSSNPDALTAIGNTLYFRANDGSSGDELSETPRQPDGEALAVGPHTRGEAGQLENDGSIVCTRSCSFQTPPRFTMTSV